MVEFLGPVKIFAGEMEMEALAEGAYRVLSGEEEAQSYDSVPLGFTTKEEFLASISER